MSRAEEIYPLKRLIFNQLERARKDRFNAKVLEKYYNMRVAEGISLARIHKCLCTMRMLSSLLGMPFEKAKKEDIVRLVARVEKKGLADWTKRDYRVILKQFYKWLRNWEDGSPPEVRWIKKTTKAENKRPILPKHLLTSEEKTALIEAAMNPRDKALLEVLLESGRRQRDPDATHRRHRVRPDGCKAVHTWKEGQRLCKDNFFCSVAETLARLSSVA